jgi:uncharacterized membrane protein YsdA (DUF1294 family)
VSEQTQTLLTVIAGYTALVTVASIVAYVLYGIDKRRAVAGGRRISENTLHWASLLGGWPGAIIAQRRLRHKTQKLAFRVIFWITVLLHLVAAGAVMYWFVIASSGDGPRTLVFNL